MVRAIVAAAFVAALVMAGTGSAAWGAQLFTQIDPNAADSPFKMIYQKTVFVQYPDGGQLFDLLRTKSWNISGSADSSDPGVRQLIQNMNSGITSNGSQAQISDLQVSYDFNLTGRDINTSIDYSVILEGAITDYVITQDSQRTLVDLGWRGLSATGEVVVDGVEINVPLSLIRSQEPELYGVIQGTDAEGVLTMNLINADFILEQPLTNWHFLFDPTGVSVDAGTFGLDESIAGSVVSSWTMGESSIREGIQVERVFEAEVVSDQTYVIESVQSSDQGNLNILGFGALDILDGLEIAGVTPTPPEGFATTSTGDFPVFIIYGMAGMAVIGGVAFFIYSNRALKNEKQGQQGIAPSSLVGYQTSASAGGYQTNRGEAQLRDESDYAQTRSVYEDAPPERQDERRQDPPRDGQQQADSTCGCAASADAGSECDCAMQDSCLCDATCGCDAAVCREYVDSMR